MPGANLPTHAIGTNRCVTRIFAQRAQDHRRLRPARDDGDARRSGTRYRRFQIITEHAPETFDFNRTYLDVDRIDRFVLVHVTLSAGRSIEAKQAFYARLAELLTGRSHCAPRISPSSWSRTSAPTGPSVVGEASYVVIPREQSR